MDVPIETLACFLDDAMDNAPQGSGTLRQQLRTYESAASSQFNTVGTLSSVAKNSASQSYRGPGLGSLTLVQIQNAWRMLIKLYDDFKQLSNWLYQTGRAWFIAEFVTNVPQGVSPYQQDPDFAVYTLSMRWLNNDFTTVEDDLSLMRIEPTAAAYQVQGVTW